MDLGQQILALKAELAKASVLRATAEGHLAVARQQVEEADAGLRALGIAPDQADVELAALEAGLAALVTELQQKIASEVAVYTGIVSSAKAALQGETR